MFSEKSKWIGCNNESSPIIIKQFYMDELQKGIIDICGLGYYELFVNGERVGNDYFKPVVSDYSERDFSEFLYPLQDKTSHTIYYNTYNITNNLRKGKNTLAVMLGNGFYRQTKRLVEGNTKFGDELLLRFELHLGESDRTESIYSDGSEKVIESFIKENNLFFGETHDYSDFSFDSLTDSELTNSQPVHIVPSPKAKLLKQPCKNDAVREKLIPQIVKKTDESTLYDVGKNISGFVCLKALSPLVRVRHAEILSNGTLDFSSAGGNQQISENIYKNAEGLTVHPWFSWSGFRYFEVFGEVEDVTALFVCSDVKVTADFRCGNETINWLFRAYLQTQLSNMHSGVPSDCPHRERLGYTGDGQVTAESVMLVTDSRDFYKKWMRDIADCQDIETGHIQHTAPFFGGGGGPGGWGCAIVTVPYAYYKVYADKGVLKKYYPNMIKYLQCMKGFCENGLVVKERDKGWCLGEWCAPGGVKLPEPFVNTFYYVRCMETVQKIADLIGEKIDYTQDITDSKRAMEDAFFDKETGNFCQGVQGANAFALTLGLGNAKTKSNLLEQYRNTKALDTGIFGTDILAEYLAEQKEVQLLFDLLSSQEQPSFGYMQKNGATTLWETWGGKASHSHPMFGGCVKQFFYGFLGLKADAGFKHITLSPTYIEGMEFLEASIKFPKGTLKVKYRYEDGKVLSKISTTGSLAVDVI